jgi:phosphoribosylformimino-5-aminoimidazole carboxamide ribotide isomerase
VYVIPAVDVLDGKVVRLRQGRYDDVTVYDDDPGAMVGSWVAQGAEIVHVVDLAGARDGSGDRALQQQLGETGLPFQIGGGIRTVADATEAVEFGAARVVLGTTAVWDPLLLQSVVGAVGSDRIVASIDVRDGKATGAGWLDEGRDLEAVLSDLVDAGVSRILATGIATDGTLEGPDTTLLADVTRIAPSLALIASGGVGSLSDLVEISRHPVEAAIVGRALYDRRFTLADAQTAITGSGR